ncbi:hypothetical protein [Nocardia sp. NBC_00511]|uniref:hypothetical protein n=1 Tax=Nocardia sp. NBC_00511 TaxID=2903591 RepID=UPI002F91AD31
MSGNRLLYLLIGGCAVVILAAATLSLTGRHSGPNPSPPVPGSDSAFAPGGAAADTAQSAAETALTAVFTWQPVTDTSSADGLERAKPWLTGELLAAADTRGDTERAIPQWASWRAARDVVTASPATTAVHAASGRSAQVEVQVHQTVLHPDGSATTYRQMDITATTAMTAVGWRLAGFTITSAHTKP